MIKGPLLHPQILRALGAAGHGSRILIADGNYPVSTATPATAERVHLNLRPGCVPVPEVLATLLQAVPVESAALMQPRDGGTPPIQTEIRDLLGATIPVEELGRHDFYAAAKSGDTALVIATGEQRRFANVLLTIGVIRLPEDRDTPKIESIRHGNAPLRT